MTRRPDRAAAAALALLCVGSGSEDVQLRTFDAVYARVSAVHPRPEQLGTDWEQAYQRLRPIAAAADTNAEVAIPIEALLRTLPGRHHALLRTASPSETPTHAPASAPAAPTPAPGARAQQPSEPPPDADAPAEAVPFRYDTEPVPSPARPWQPDEQGMPGLLPVATANGVRVGWVSTQGPAYAAGVRAGDRILAIDGAPCPGAAACLAPELPTGHQRALTIASLDGGPARTLQLEADQPRVRVSPALGATPAMRTETWGDRLLLSHGGYAELVGLNVMSVAGGQFLHERLSSLSADGARGLILDLRENPGGLVQLSSAIGSYLFAAPTVLGHLRTRADSLSFRTLARPAPQLFTRPVAVLVSEGSGSTAEFIAGALQATGRARVFGSQTMGAVESALIEPLPNGDRLQLVIATIELPSGAALDGVGVRPDVTAPRPAQRGASGEDLTLALALAWIDGVR